MVATLWALWMMGSNRLQTEPVAYFKTQEEYSRVSVLLKTDAPYLSMRCIPAQYVIGR